MKLLTFKLSLILVLLPFSFSVAHAQQANPVPKLNRVVWIWLENARYSELIQQKYIKNLMKFYPSARFTHYTPESNVTQTNAMVLTAGSDLGITDNSPTRVLSPNLLDLLESKNISWKVYAEDYPGACYLGAGTATYKRYRVPFLSMARVQSDRYECMKITGISSYLEDLRFGNQPRLSVVIPNLPHGGVNSQASMVDANLKTILDSVVTAPDFLSTTTVFISTLNYKPNEPEPHAMFGMILGNGVADGAVYLDDVYQQANFLRTLEDGFELGTLNGLDQKAEPIVGFWN
jgi:hypothetical protein